MGDIMIQSKIERDKMFDRVYRTLGIKRASDLSYTRKDEDILMLNHLNFIDTKGSAYEAVLVTAAGEFHITYFDGKVTEEQLVRDIRELLKVRVHGELKCY